MGKAYVYDIEVFSNYFLVIFKAFRGDETIIIEYSEDFNINTLELLKQFDDENIYLISYNGIDFDNILINYIIKNNFKVTNKQLFGLSNYVIEGKVLEEAREKLKELQKSKSDVYVNYDLFGKVSVIGNKKDATIKLTNIINKYKHIGGKYYKNIKPYKNGVYKSIDLLRMLFSKKLRVSLKAVQIMLKWHNVLECELPFDEPINKSDIDTVIEYCENDVNSTKYLANWCKKDIQLRFNIQKQYNIECLSMDGVKIGVELMTKFITDEYAQNNNLTKGEAKLWFKSLKPYTESFKYGKVINNFIKFKDPVLKDLLKEIKSFKYVHKIKYFSKRIKFRNTIYDIGSGGLHSFFSKSCVIVPKKGEVYYQSDFSGYYPNQRMRIGRTHNVLGEYYTKHDKIATQEKVKAKANKDKGREKTFKLIGNSLFGNFANEWSQFCDVEYAAFQTINGQLMLLMLIEWYEDAGIKVYAANTDSVDIIFDKSKLDLVNSISDKWTKMTNGITIDADELSKTVYYDVNCYVMQFVDGKIKEKGRWVTHYDHKGNWNPQMLNKGFKHPVIQIALREYFINNVPVEETIMAENDILDYCLAQKVNRDFRVYHGSDKVQRINRYFVSNSKDARYLYKVKNNKTSNLLKSYPVEIINKVKDADRSNKLYDINYSWYIKECNKVIEEVMPSQLTLF